MFVIKIGLIESVANIRMNDKTPATNANKIELYDTIFPPRLKSFFYKMALLLNPRVQ